jgi:hypothetical protein
MTRKNLTCPESFTGETEIYLNVRKNYLVHCKIDMVSSFFYALPSLHIPCKLCNTMCGRRRFDS